MFRRTFTVVFKPMKNNYVLLSESYFQVVSTYERGCLCLTSNTVVQYMSWAPYTLGAHYIGDNEIGLNATVAENIGLKEGSLVKCNLVAEAMVLYSVTAAATSEKDWEMIDMNSKRIQNTLLDQTRIITQGQKLIVWLNKSMHITLKIDRIGPNLPFGKIENDTQLTIVPFTSVVRREKPAPENFRISHCQSEIIPREQFEINEFMKSMDDKLKKRIKHLENISQQLIKDAPNSIHLRVIKGRWNDTNQMSDIFVSEGVLPSSLNLNQIFLLNTKFDREYYVNIKIKTDNNFVSKGNYPTVEINDILMSQLDIEPYEKVILKPKNFPINFIDKVELLPSKKATYRLREIEQLFKQFIIDNSKLYPMLINRNQIFKLKDDLYVTTKIHPESFKFCTIDGAILRECRISTSEHIKEVDSILVTSKTQEHIIYNDKNLVSIEKFDNIVDDCVERFKINLCLDERNRMRKMENLLLVGPYNSGKSAISSKILHELSASPFDCYFDIFYCSKNKGRKPESIQKDLRQILINCMNFNPSILILDNLDMLTVTVTEQTQEAEYFNRISDVIHNLILEYTRNSSISVIATISSISNLNKRVYTSRGRHIFQQIIHIPDLEKNERETIIKGLCKKCKFNKNINWRRFSNLTEGYKVGDLVQFVDRALFYAARNDTKAPILTDEIFINSLKTTNTYCLQGIENHNNKIENELDNENINEIAGMENVVEVLEEVLMWPSKYPDIFEKSPLRNQAGVLLFGPPGTGKTYLVAQIARTWNLRMISVKGPELLAKYIGQSEENVRNLFNKARSAKPCVLFFDEFDSLAPRRGHDSTGVTDRVVNQMLTELDGVEGLHGVIVIAATSRPELLDPALLRSGRIDRLVECTLPNEDARHKIFVNLSKSLNLAKNVNFKYFLDKTQNFTGADIQSILTTANMFAVKECLAKDSENVPDKIEVTQNHLMESFISTRPSLTPQDIIKYKQMYARFTNKDKGPREQMQQRATLA